MTFRFYVCLLLLIGGIAIGGAFLRQPVRGSVILSNTIPDTARPMQIPDYSGQALRLSAGKISGAIDRAANGPQTPPKLPTPPKVHTAERPIGAWTTETTFVAAVENPPSPSVADIDTGSRMTLGGPIMRPVGVIQEDGGQSPSSVPAVTPRDVSQKPVATPTSLRSPPRPESPRASESTNLFVHPLGF
jgi:hypothetical protein